MWYLALPPRSLFQPRRDNSGASASMPTLHGQCDSGVHPLHDCCWCSSQSKRLVCAPGCLTQRSAPARAHTCLYAPAHLPLLQTSLGPQLCCRLSPAYAQVWLRIPLPSSSLCPQSAKWPPGTLRPFSAFPFWVFQEDKEQENTSVNSMFLGCLIKRDKIAEELRAGLAGVGSHARPPQNAASG